MQYPNKKAKVNDTRSLKSPEIIKTIPCGELVDTVALSEEKAEKYIRDIELIEKTAQEIDAFLAPWIIESVTKDIPFWKLAMNGMPTNEKEFCLKRRQFYALLALKRGMI